MNVTKYAFWAWLAMFIYHYIMLKKKEEYRRSGMVVPLFCDWVERFEYHVQGISQILTRPPVEALLPDPPPLPPGAIWPKTLVLNMRGTLVHSEYKFGEGFEFKKRPGLNAFLNRVSQKYEVVLFGDEESATVNEVADALDPQYRVFTGWFGHEHTLLKDKQYIKDMSYMNWDINKIVVIDFDDEKIKFQKDNVIVLP